MNLVLDIGNSNAKAGLFDSDDLIRFYSDVTPENLNEIIDSNSISRSLISNVGSKPEPYLEKLKNLDPLILTHELPLPITLEYDTPDTLGNDRIAGVCGAKTLFPNDCCLVIDCGTCVTYDVITESNVYLGGAISPGMNMRFQSLNTFTSNLPLVKAEQNVKMIGKSTHECIQSGVTNGMVGEMDTYIRHCLDVFRDLKVVMCGGDTIFFENKLKARIFAAPELVLRGLNRILNHNV